MADSNLADKNLILVMGLTGSGKTFFINQLTGQGSLVEGHGLKSCTERCQIVETCIGNTEFVIMDCPGFDDTKRSDTEILKEIAEQLSAIRILGYNLKGIVYLHRITDNKMSGTAVRNLDLFTKLVGEDALSNVVLVTTMWGNVTDVEKANERDSELRDEYWGDMRRKGSTATRFDGTTASAEGIVSQLLGKRTVILKVQEQLVDQKMQLNQTAAGAFLEPTIHREEAQYRERLTELEKELQHEKNGNKRLEAKRSQRRNAAGLQQRMEDKEILKSKPGEEVETKLQKLKKGSQKFAIQSVQVLAAVCSIAFTVAGFLLV
ncbi:P-loop containing nucleoside triphosphate hydrolase protein [Cadophora sp. MPI-SDFR-AT-0126]|nr:P-loop containing nucleoside triphosphate hydrolase protein [Leotiomycetes sp. MPI-SDFR-AT-0126]